MLNDIGSSQVNNDNDSSSNVSRRIQMSEMMVLAPTEAEAAAVPKTTMLPRHAPSQPRPTTTTTTRRKRSRATASSSSSSSSDSIRDRRTTSTSVLMLLIAAAGSVMLSPGSAVAFSPSVINANDVGITLRHQMMNNMNGYHDTFVDANCCGRLRRPHHRHRRRRRLSHAHAHALDDIFTLSMASPSSRQSSSSSSSSSSTATATATRTTSGGHRGVGGMRVEMAEQKVTVSAEKREAAVRAMKRDAMASALEGIDAQMLEMLSEEFLFPSTFSSTPSHSSSDYDGLNGGGSSSSSSPSSPSSSSSQYDDIVQYEELEPDYGPPPSSTRPAGRAMMVPGAMRRDTMAKYKKRRNLVKYIKQTTESAASSLDGAEIVGEGSQEETDLAIPSSSNSFPSTSSMLDNLESRIHVKSREIARTKCRIAQQHQGMETTTKRSHNTQPGTDTAADVATESLPGTSLSDAGEEGDSKTDVGSKLNSKKSPSKKRRVVKNLPKRKTTDLKSLDDSFKNLMSSDPDATARNKKRRKARGSSFNQVEFRKYYQIDLLVPEQEFELGHKIQTVVKCERVHEGLALRDMQLPTIREWAQACGYTDPDPDFDEDAVIHKDVRPVGAEKMFEKTDPNMFVGNGLAHTMGVGRGRGRAKKPPPTVLGDIYEIDTKTGQKMKGTTTPINRGTVSDFVEMMLDGRKAKQLMVQSNMRLVVSICRKYSNVGVSLHDLVQEGSIGLSRAADKYDPSKGFKFSTYASWWIQQAVFRSIAYHSRTIRLPVHIHNMLNRVRKVRSTLQQGLGRPPTDEEMADAMDMRTSKYKRMLTLTRRSISLELPQYQQNPKDQGFESEDTLADITTTNNQNSDSGSDNVSPERTVDRTLFHEDLKGMLKKLTKDERTVIALRYGLADGLTRTITSVAAELKQTPSVVRSHESKALRKLRRPWYEKKLDEHRQSLLG